MDDEPRALDDLTPVAMCGLCGEPWTQEHADEGTEHYQLEDEPAPTSFCPGSWERGSPDITGKLLMCVVCDRIMRSNGWTTEMPEHVAKQPSGEA